MKTVKGKSQVDWIITIIPFLLILILGISFFIFPKESNMVLQRIRHIFGDTFGVLFLIFGFFRDAGKYIEKRIIDLYAQRVY